MKKVSGGQKLRVLFIMLLALTVLAGTACADTYRTIVGSKSIVLDSSWKENPNPNVLEGWFIREADNKTTEGDFLIARASQYLYLTPLFSDRENLRFFNDVIYTGDIKTSYWDPNGFSPFDVLSVTMKFGYGIKRENYSLGAEAFTAKGGLYASAIMNEDGWRGLGTYAELFQWIAENGEEYCVGYYDEELAEKGFLLCVFTDDAVKNDKWNEGEMLLGHWSGTSGYSEIYFNEDSELYRQAKEAYTTLKLKVRLNYKRAMGLPEDIRIGKNRATVHSTTNTGSMVLYPDGRFSASLRNQDEKKGTWTYRDGTLVLSFNDGTTVTGQGDPLTLSFGEQEFTMHVIYEEPEEKNQ